MRGVVRLQVYGAAGWCARKQLRLDRTIRELGMCGNYYIDHKTFNIITILFFNEIKFCH